MGKPMQLGQLPGTHPILIAVQLGFVGWTGFALSACHQGVGRHGWDTTALQMLHVAEVEQLIWHDSSHRSNVADITISSYYT